MAKDTGGYAFPIPNADFQKFQPETVDEYKRIQSGMTLRDYFAAKAMNAFVANPNIMKTAVRADVDAVAKEAYRFADAMLSARGQ